MAVNKVIYGGNTLIDLTGDTVTAADLADGVKATGADGKPIVGLLPKVTIDSQLSGNSTNPVQNNVIKAALDGKVNTTDKIYEANLEWGGRNISSGYSPIDGAMISSLGANRFAFGKVAGITVEYSEDAGETWVEYPLTAPVKVGLFSTGSTYLYAGGEKSRPPSVNDMIRVTIDSDAFGTYTALNKFAIEISTGGNKGCYCTIDAALESSPTAFEVFADKVPISGWSGYNIINTQAFETYGNQPTRQYGIIRFTFGCTTVPTNPGYKGLALLQIMGFGGAGWKSPSNMAKHGHLYDFNAWQQAIFPDSVTATNFIGKVNGFDVKASVPANAKFTDTVYTHPSTHPASMITGLAAVATSGSYNDLSDKPTIVKTVNNVAPDSNGNVDIATSGGVTVDEELSSTSTNPVQNKAIYNALLNKVGTEDIFNGFTLRSPTASIMWRVGSQPLGSLTASNYTGTSLRATQDSDGNVINTTYAKKTDITDFAKTSVTNSWTVEQLFSTLAISFEKYLSVSVSGTSHTPTMSTMVYDAAGNFTLDLFALASKLDGGDTSVFSAYFRATGDYSLTISNAGTIKYTGSASDIGISSTGLLLNILMTRDASGNLTSIVQASKLEGGA